MKQQIGHASNAGFTLIELLVVMGIIGILAGLLFTNFTGARERARDSRRKSDLAQIKNALRLYYNDYQKYPQTNSGYGAAKGFNGGIQGCGIGPPPGQSNCAWGTSFSVASTIYMNSIPNDPLYNLTTNTPNYVYSVGALGGGASNDHFVLQATLENAGDPQITSSQTQCGATTIAVNIYMVCD